MTPLDAELDLVLAFYAGTITPQQLATALRYEQKTGAVYRASVVFREAIKSGRIAVRTDIDR